VLEAQREHVRFIVAALVMALPFITAR